MPVHLTRRTFALVAISAILGCCGPSAPAGTSTRPASQPSTSETQLMKYSGPACKATLTGSGADAKAIVAVEVPTGGWELKLDRVWEQGAHARVELTLVSPGDGVMVTQAFETKRVEAKLPAVCTKAEIVISQEKAGLAYFRKPDYELAETLTRGR